MNLKSRMAVVAVSALFATAGSAGANPSTPTCSDVEFLDIEVHGQHVIRDYVAGDHEMDWPPSGQNLGGTVRDNGGVAVKGGPGPGFHFENGVAPGASFCTNSRSPGVHL